MAPGECASNMSSLADGPCDQSDQDRRKLYRLSTQKLGKIKDYEVKLRRVVLIRNTALKYQQEETSKNLYATEKIDDIGNVFHDLESIMDEDHLLPECDWDRTQAAVFDYLEEFFTHNGINILASETHAPAQEEATEFTTFNTLDLDDLLGLTENCATSDVVCDEEFCANLFQSLAICGAKRDLDLEGDNSDNPAKRAKSS